MLSCIRIADLGRKFFVIFIYIEEDNIPNPTSSVVSQIAFSLAPSITRVIIAYYGLFWLSTLDPPYPFVFSCLFSCLFLLHRKLNIH